MKRIFIFLVMWVSAVEIHGDIGYIKNSGKISGLPNFREMLNESTGVASLKRTQFSKITNYGKVELDQCTALDQVESVGIFTANKTNFFKDLILGEGETTLISCDLENLIITFDQTPPKITLKENTIIHGQVVFTKSPGVIYKSKDVVIRGEIVNGKIIDLTE